MREEDGNREEAERPYLIAADYGDYLALDLLGQMREKTGNREEAKRFARQAANTGNTQGWTQQRLNNWWPYGLDPDGTPTPPWQ
ncbi:hypothetical protein OG859_41290 [Streptomyces sp. NBC_00048]